MTTIYCLDAPRLTMGKPNRNELKYGSQRFIAVIDGIARIISTAIRWAGVVGIFYLVFRMVQCLSGKQTQSNIVFQVLGNMTINQWLAYVLAGGCSAWAVTERAVRRRKVAALASRTKELEKIIDKDRTSSNLPATGQTRKDDQV